jgi:hypothetical protein
VRRTSRRNALRAAERVYQGLLFAYPVTHRREYGGLMAQVFRDMCRDSYRQKGLVGLVGLWRHILADTAVTAVAEHIYALREGGQIMAITRRQHWMVLALAGLPLELGTVLYLINPAFMGQMVTPNAAQPAGWVMAGVVLLLAGVAYAIQRRIIALAQAPALSGQVAYGRASRIAWSIVLGPFRSIALNGHRRKGFFFACSVLFLVLPGALLVLFGPAAMTVLNAGLYP